MRTTSYLALMGFVTLATLLAAPRARAQTTTPVPLPAWLHPTPAPAPAPLFTPTEDEAQMCPLRPSRVSILKIGLAPDRGWRRQYPASIPLTIGFERRITPDLSLTAAFGSALAPWVSARSAYPKLRAFDVTLGGRLYLGSLWRGGAQRPEFSGPYVALESRRLFTSVPGAADGSGTLPTTTYQYTKSQQLVLGQQIRVGAHGLLDMSAGLRRSVGPGGGRASFVPTASLTFGLIY